MPGMSGVSGSEVEAPHPQPASPRSIIRRPSSTSSGVSGRTVAETTTIAFRGRYRNGVRIAALEKSQYCAGRVKKTESSYGRALVRRVSENDIRGAVNDQIGIGP